MRTTKSINLGQQWLSSDPVHGISEKFRGIILDHPDRVPGGPANRAMWVNCSYLVPLESNRY